MTIESWIPIWRAPLTALLAGWGHSWGQAEELAQDTLVEAYLARERLRGDPLDRKLVGPWLRGIARNLHRARLRQRGPVLSLAQVAPDPPAPEPQTPDGEAEDSRLEALRSELQHLPEGPRTLLYLHYLDETPMADVAALLGLSTRAVEGRLHRARNLLRDRLNSKETR